MSSTRLNRSRGRALVEPPGAQLMNVADGASGLEIEGLDNLTQDRSIPVTEQAISPLRRRMIEDMSIKFAAKTQHDYVQRVPSLAALPTLPRRTMCAAFDCI
jgi:hypothetical protein